MNTLNEENSNLVESVFEELNSENIKYVIPRGYKNLPETYKGGDIDVLTPDIEDATKVCESFGLKTPSTTLPGKVRILINLALMNPPKALSMALDSPRNVIKIIRRISKGFTRDSLAPDYKQTKPRNDSFVIHFVNHLAHKSPTGTSKIRLDPEVERLMINDRENERVFFTASPPDELAHLLARGIFDYSGEFPEYYIKRCNSLSEEVFSSKKYKNKFKRVSELIWYDASEVIISGTKEKNFNSLRKNLITFDSY